MDYSQNSNVVMNVVKPATAKEVADWLAEKMKIYKRYPHYLVVQDIKKEFGAIFIDKNDSGYDAIDPNVLRKFRKLTKDTVVWERGDREWRQRERYDSPGRQQD